MPSSQPEASPAKAVTITTFSADRDEVPDWVSTSLNVGKKKVALLEVNSSCDPLYGKLVRYLGQRAVDVDEKPPTYEERLHSDPTSTKRQWGGVLTSRYVREKYERFRRDVPVPKEEDDKVHFLLGSGWGRVKTNMSLPEKEKDDEEKVAASDTGSSSSAEPNGDEVAENGHTTENGTSVANGTANTEPRPGGNEDIFFHHYKVGEPREENYRLMQMRVLEFYATSDAALEALCDDAKQWIEEQADALLEVTESTFLLYSLRVRCGNAMWDCQGHRNSRPKSSVFLRPGVMDSIIDDANDFLNPDTKAFYMQHGIPYRRSYLFYGPPGQGKTSTIKVMAGRLGLKACFMSFTDRSFSDRTLNQALNTAPKPALIIAEDIDALFNEDRLKADPTQSSTLSFSGFLNGIDGMVSSEEGIIVIMTTNHPEKLDPALLRCGRCDRRFEFPCPGKAELASLFASYYPDAEKALGERFANAVFERREKDARSIATLQQHFLFTRRDSAERSIERLHEFFKDHGSSGKERRSAGYHI